MMHKNTTRRILGSQNFEYVRSVWGPLNLQSHFLHPISGLLASETTSLINLFTSLLLLYIVWTVLGPVIDGTLLLVPNNAVNRRSGTNHRSGIGGLLGLLTGGGGGHWWWGAQADEYGTNFDSGGYGGEGGEGGYYWQDPYYDGYYGYNGGGSVEVDGEWDVSTARKMMASASEDLMDVVWKRIAKDKKSDDDDEDV